MICCQNEWKSRCGHVTKFGNDEGAPDKYKKDPRIVLETSEPTINNIPIKASLVSSKDLYNIVPTMRFSTIFSGLTLAATGLAAPSVVVHNNCDFDIFVTSVGSSVGNTTKVQPDTLWTEEEYFSGTGTAIKIARSATALWTAKPVLHLSYTYDQGKSLYYDLSTVYGFDFDNQNITVTGDEGKNVTSIKWVGTPGPIHTFSYFGETGLHLETCAA